MSAVSLQRTTYGSRPAVAVARVRVIEALAKQQPTPGMRVKPILPGKIYHD